MGRLSILSMLLLAAAPHIAGAQRFRASLSAGTLVQASAPSTIPLTDGATGQPVAGAIAYHGAGAMAITVGFDVTSRFGIALDALRAPADYEGTATSGDGTRVYTARARSAFVGGAVRAVVAVPMASGRLSVSAGIARVRFLSDTSSGNTAGMAIPAGLAMAWPVSRTLAVRIDVDGYFVPFRTVVCGSRFSALDNGVRWFVGVVPLIGAEVRL